jgi:hypothetical protein
MIEAILDQKKHIQPRLKSIKPRILEPPPTPTVEITEDYPQQNDRGNADMLPFHEWFQNPSRSDSTSPRFPKPPQELEVREFGMDSWINEVEGIGEDPWEPLSSSMILEVEKEIFPDG